MKRSNNFNYFTAEKDPTVQRKNTLKKVFKWLKILFYTFFFGLTLTGCIQNFVVASSNTVGNGIEFYNSKKDVVPRVNTLDAKETITSYVDANGETQSFTTKELKGNALDTVLLNDRNVLEKLREQSQKNGGNFGEYNSLTSSFYLNVSEEEFSNPDAKIFVNNGKYLFATNGNKTYEFVNEIKPIYVLAPLNNNVVAQISKVTETTTDENGTQSVKDKLYTDEQSQEKRFGIKYVSGLARINDYSSDAYVAKPTLKYSRDVLQLYYNYEFGPSSEFYKQLGSDVSEFLKSKIDSIQDKTIVGTGNNSPLFYLTPKQYSLVNYYSNRMKVILSNLGWYKKETVENVAIDFSSSKNFLVDDALKYNADSNILDTRTDEKELLGSGGTVQNPVTDWGQSWQYGPFYGLIVYPFSALINAITNSLPTLDGWSSIIAILVLVLLTRLFSLFITFKATIVQSAQEDLRVKKAAIENKYKGFENNKQMKMRKQKEIADLYKKNNINVLDGFLPQLVAMPIFFAMWRAIQAVPSIKATTWLGINFGATSWREVIAGNFIYLWIIIVVVIIQFTSQLIPHWLNKKRLKERTTVAEVQALKKSERYQTIFIIVFTFMAIIFTAGVQVYWLFTGIWQTFQVIGLHKLRKTQWFKNKYSRKKPA